MDNRQTQQNESSPHDEETNSSASLVRSRPEQIRYLRMSAGPTVVDMPPFFNDILTENRLAQMATVDQQRELMHYTRRLNEWVGREVGERHDDLRRLRALFEQIGQDVRDWQDEEEEEAEETASASGDSVETTIRMDFPPQQLPGMPANQPQPTAQHHNQQPPPVSTQPQSVIVVLPSAYAPGSIPAASRPTHRPRQLLPPPQQHITRASPDPPSFIHPDFSGPGMPPLRHSTPPTVPVPPRSGMGPNVLVMPESSSGSPSHGIPGMQSGMPHRRSADQPFPSHLRQSMGSDINIVPLSTASTRSSSPVGRTTRLAQRGSVASLRGRGSLRQTPSGRSLRPQGPLVVASTPSPVPFGHRFLGPASSTPSPPPVIHPAPLQPIAAMQQPAQPQPMIQLPLSPMPAAVPGPRQIQEAEFPILRPPPGQVPHSRFTPVPSTRPPALMPRAPMEQYGTALPVIIQQPSPVSRHEQLQPPVQATQPPTRISPSRLTKHRPPPTMIPPNPEVVLMPARRDSIRTHQRHQLRPIDTNVVVPTPTVTAMAYPETASHVRVTTPFIHSQPSPAPSRANVRFSTQGPAEPIAIETSPSFRRRPPSPIQATQPPSRLTKRPSRPRVPSPPQPEIVVMPTRTGSMRHQLRPVTAITYPETVSHVRTTFQRPPTPYIVPQRSPVSSDDSSQTSMEFVERPALISRSQSRSSIRGRPPPTHPVIRQTSPSLPPIGHALSPQPEVVVMPTRTSTRNANRQSHPQTRFIDTSTAVTAMTYPENVSHAGTASHRPTTPYIVPVTSSDSSSSSSMEAVERPEVIRGSRSRHIPVTQPVAARLTKRRPEPTTAILPSQPEVVRMPTRSESIRSRQSTRHLQPFDSSNTGIPTPAVTTMGYPETVSSHLQTPFQRAPTPYIVPQSVPSSLSSDNNGNGTSSSSSFQPQLDAEERPAAVLRKNPSRSSVRPAPLPSAAMAIPVVPASRPIGNILPSSGPGIVVMPARSPSLRSSRHRRRGSSDDSSVVILSDEESGSERGAELIAEALEREVPPSGAVVVPLDSEAEEAMGFASPPTPTPPPLTRRTSFSGRDWVNYESRSNSSNSFSGSPGDSYYGRGSGYHGNERSYNGGDSRNPSFRRRERSRTPTSRRSGSPPRVYHHPTSADLWDQSLKKSRSRSASSSKRDRGWYGRRPTSLLSIESSPADMYANTLLQRPPRPDTGRGRVRTDRGAPLGSITNTVRGESRGGTSRGFGSRESAEPPSIGEVIARGERVEKQREWSRSRSQIFGTEAKAKNNWLGWVNNL